MDIYSRLYSVKRDQDMLIKLTNRHPKYQNETLLLNTDSMVSVFRALAERETGESEQVTMVHSPPHGTWEVAETPEEILLLAHRKISLD